MELDLKLISGEFLYDDLPVLKEYLKHYFKGDIQLRFVVYYLNFKDILKSKNVMFFCNIFVEHTGIACDEKWILKLLKKVRMIETAVETAIGKFDLESLSDIKNGQVKLRKLGWTNMRL